MFPSETEITSVEKLIVESIQKKLRKYERESSNMPFHDRLLGHDRMAVFSFIQSVNTTFGMSIFEPIAEILARRRFAEVKRQFVVGNKISERAQFEIQGIMNDLSDGKTPNKHEEIQRIRATCQQGNMNTLRTAQVDLFLKNHEGSIFLFDLKTAKPNKSQFQDYKRMLLNWCAIILAKTPDIDVHTLIAIPYNPYEPRPYKEERWTVGDTLDFEQELKVAEDFWDFLCGDHTYRNLLDCFKRVGIALQAEIDQFLDNFES